MRSLLPCRIFARRLKPPLAHRHLPVRFACPRAKNARFCACAPHRSWRCGARSHTLPIRKTSADAKCVRARVFIELSFAVTDRGTQRPSPFPHRPPRRSRSLARQTDRAFNGSFVEIRGWNGQTVQNQTDDGKADRSKSDRRWKGRPFKIRPTLKRADRF